MGHSVISLGLGLGIGKAATISGLIPSSGAFRVTIFDTESNIVARTGDLTGTIAYATDTNNLYIYDGLVWVEYDNNFTV